jgi:hypothetical protein
VARNGGFQEAHVAIADTLPAGLTPVLEALPKDVSYESATRTLTWPAQLLWPGQWVQHSFEARVDASLGATTLENQATFHAFWPNTDLLPPAERQQFLDREQTKVARASVVVDPNLPANADVTPPTVILVQPYKMGVDGSEVPLNILAGLDARRMYLREWTPDPITGAWTMARDSGWIDYSRAFTWTLSAGQGVKYLGVWVADQAGNVSTLNEHSLIFVNRMDASQALADGQRVQYRGLLDEGASIALVLTTIAGDPDLYIWHPRNAFLPDRYTNDTVLPGQDEYLSSYSSTEGGCYLMEAQAVGASKYELSLNGEVPSEPNALQALAAKVRPAHPLTVSDPLSAGQVGPAVTLRSKIYLPVMYRNN